MSGGGQADLGSQAGSTLAGRADEQDLGQDQPGSVGKGFIGTQERGQPVSKEAGSSASAKATGGTDFAVEGRGASEETEDEDEESGEGPRDVGSGGPGSSV